MSVTAKEFYNKTIGKSIDIDGTSGVQCVDLFKYFCKLNYGSYTSTGTGYADGYYTKRKTNGLLNNFNDMGTTTSLQNGDWVFWAYGSKIAPKSHVAMYYNGKFLGQNQNNVSKATLISMSLTGLKGVLRPKIYVTTSSNVKYTTSDLNVRTGAGTSYSAVNILAKNTAVTVYETSGNWSRIQTDMWVSSKYLTSTKPSNHYKSMEVTNCTSLNVRKGAGTNYAIVKSIPVNCVVSVLTISGTWTKIADNQWVSTKYLK